MVMGGLVAVGAVVAGWAYYRSQGRRRVSMLVSHESRIRQVWCCTRTRNVSDPKGSRTQEERAGWRTRDVELTFYSIFFVWSGRTSPRGSETPKPTEEVPVVGEGG
jgi:hypothetical protein